MAAVVLEWMRVRQNREAAFCQWDVKGAQLAMPTATSEKIRSRAECLSASMQAARDTIRQPLLEKLSAILEAQRGMEQALREGLAEGLESKALQSDLASLRSKAERGADFFRQALALFEGDAAAVPALAAQLREAEGFLTWLGSLEARVSAADLPFDEARLSPAPAGPTAEGYLSVPEARSRLRARRNARRARPQGRLPACAGQTGGSAPAESGAAAPG